MLITKHAINSAFIVAFWLSVACGGIAILSRLHAFSAISADPARSLFEHFLSSLAVPFFFMFFSLIPFCECKRFDHIPISIREWVARRSELQNYNSMLFIPASLYFSFAVCWEAYQCLEGGYFQWGQFVFDILGLALWIILLRVVAPVNSSDT